MESMCRSKKDKKDKKEKDNNIRSTFTCINTRKHPTIWQFAWLVRRWVQTNRKQYRNRNHVSSPVAGTPTPVGVGVLLPSNTKYSTEPLISKWRPYNKITTRHANKAAGYQSVYKYKDPLYTNFDNKPSLYFGTRVVPWYTAAARVSAPVHTELPPLENNLCRGAPLTSLTLYYLPFTAANKTTLEFKSFVMAAILTRKMPKSRLQNLLLSPLSPLHEWETPPFWSYELRFFVPSHEWETPQCWCCGAHRFCGVNHFFGAHLFFWAPIGCAMLNNLRGADRFFGAYRLPWYTAGKQKNTEVQDFSVPKLITWW